MRYLFVLVCSAAAFGAQARYARLGEYQGKVEVQLRPSDAWMAAERNLPLPEAAWLRTGAASRLEIELDEGSAIRIAANSQFELADYTRLATGQRVTTISLDQGVAYFTGSPEGRDSLVLAVPGAQLTVSRGARIRLEVQEQWSRLSILQGGAHFSSPAAELDLREGQTTRVEPSNTARFFLYSEIAPVDSDRWSDDRDKALASSTSAAHVIERYGLVDLDTAGEWIQTEDLGPVWKPKAAPGWLPFQNGRWRWYDGLGYTWVSDDTWGWLPYHYGRWSHRDEIGWIWAPSPNAIFKPGDVYWLRGKNFLGWGPMAPGEQWTPGDPVNSAPQQFLAARTTYATFQPEAPAIDPAGFDARPKDPLAVAAFIIAPPSPAFLSARLEALRPFLWAGRSGVKPVVEGATVDTAPLRPIVVMPPAPPPVVIVTPPPVIETTETVAVPVPVPAGIVFIPQPAQATNPKPAAPVTVPSKPAAPPSTLTSRNDLSHSKRPVTPGAAGPRPKRFHGQEESDMYNAVLQDLTRQNSAKAVRDLNTWTEHYRESDYAGERHYYYMQAFNALDRPAETLERAMPLFTNDLRAEFQDSMQILGVLYLTSLNAQKVPHPTSLQLSLGRAAAQELLRYIPICFTAENKPPATTAADWQRTRDELAGLAKQTLARH